MGHLLQSPPTAIAGPWDHRGSGIVKLVYIINGGLPGVQHGDFSATTVDKQKGNVPIQSQIAAAPSYTLKG